MPDISELILQVKNADNAVKEIDKVDKKLKQTAISSEKISALGKTIFATWSFTKVIGLAKKMGDAYSSALVTTRKFEAVFGSFNRNAANGVKVLVDRFHDTNRAAKDLMATIGSRLDFGFDDRTLGKVSADLSRISKELASFYGKNVTDVSLKLTQALGGQTRGLKEYGINIDINSDKFKHLSTEIQKATGVTKEAATALAVYSGILEKTKDKEGTFETQAKSITQYLEDIKNAFVDGPLAQAGEILSKLFGPLFKFLDWFIKNPIGEALLSLASVAVTIRGSFMLLQLSLTGIVRLLASSAIIGSLSTKVHNFFQILLNGFTSGNFKLNRVTITFRILLQRFGKGITNDLLLPITRGFLWLGVQILRPIRAFFGLFSKQIFLGFQKVMVALAGGSAKLTAFTSGPALLGIGTAFTAIGTAAVLGIVMLADEIGRAYSSTWKKVSDQVWHQISDIQESIINWIHGRGFNSNDEIVNETSKIWLEAVNKRIEKIRTLDEATKEAVQQLDETAKEIEFPDDPFKEMEKLYEIFLREKDIVDGNKAAVEFTNKAYDEFLEKLEKQKVRLSKQKAETDLLIKQGKLTVSEIQNRKNLDSMLAKEVLEMEQQLTKYEEAKTRGNIAQKEAAEKALKAYKGYDSIQKKAIELIDSRFSNFTWYQDASNKILETLKGLTPTGKIQAIQEKIEKFKELYGNAFLNPEDAKEKYKALGNLEMQKFEAEMEALNTEREFIQSTNDMIKSYLDKALEWKAQGIDAIDAGTAEGYKFMTSGFSSIANIGPILKEQTNENTALQEKANSIAEGAKNILDGIKKKLDQIPTNGLVQLDIKN